MSKRIIGVLAGAAVALSVASTAWAHHSAAQFNFGSTVDITGVVKFVRFSNPHAKLILEVTDEARGTREIEYEGHSRNNMIRQGLVPDMFAVGEKITIRIAPMRDGTDGGYVTAFVTQDGEAVGQITRPD
jgi:hypothetical protein